MAKKAVARRRTPGRRSTSTSRSAAIARRQRVRPPVPPAVDGKFAIVGVGASAGGLEAFTALLRSLPPDPRLAIVFVQHLAPQHESALTSLLSGQSELPVVQVTEGMSVLPNHVYVIPPNSQLGIAGHQLHVSPRPNDRTQYNPI